MNDTPAIGPRLLIAAVRKEIRKPKSLLLAILAFMAMLAGLRNGWSLVAPGMAGAVLIAAVIDTPIICTGKGRWSFPSGALLTGMIVAMVLSPRESWYVATYTSAIGVASKYVFRVRATNIFNPAALALVVTFHVLHPGQDWWGAMPGGTLVSLVLLLVSGVCVTNRVNKIPAVLSFLGCYYLLFTLTAFVGDDSKVAEIYREPDLYAVLFFAFFMVTDPPTSPPRHRDQLAYGAIIAIASYAFFETVGSADFFLMGLLVANGWEAWRRVSSKSQAGAPID